MTAAFIVTVGTIRVLRLNILSTAYLAAYSLVMPLRLKETPAVLLKLVSTGPGHNAPT